MERTELQRFYWPTVGSCVHELKPNAVSRNPENRHESCTIFSI